MWPTSRFVSFLCFLVIKEKVFSLKLSYDISFVVVYALVNDRENKILFNHGSLNVIRCDRAVKLVTFEKKLKKFTVPIIAECGVSR